MRSNSILPNKACVVIDVGSNSIRGQTLGLGPQGELLRSPKRLITTRLAEGLDGSGLLREANMERSAMAIAAFAAEARKEGLPSFAYATSATRDAGNREDFLRLVREKAGLALDVLSGQAEARLALLGAGAEALVDIGGGSAQFIGEGFALSFPIGCVRGREIFLPAAAAGGLEAGRKALEDRCRALMRFPRRAHRDVAGVGGSITTLAALKLGLLAYDRERVDGLRLCLEDVELLIRRLYEMGDEGRRAHPLLKERHDVILPGAIICAFMLRYGGIEALKASDRDGMEGYFLMLLGKEEG